MTSEEDVERVAQDSKGLSLPDRDRGKENWNYDAPFQERLTFRAPKPLFEELEILVEAGVFQSRSDALRAGLRSVVFGVYDAFPWEEIDDAE
jgi:hypothetical protein